MERIEDIGFGGLKLIQESESFCYGIDAVILADFAYRTCSSFRTAVDLGTGNEMCIRDSCGSWERH